MPLIVTAAGATSDSYIDVAACDVLAANDLGPEAAGWLAATLESKEKALRRATRELDGHLGSRWAPYTWGQALLFPRYIDFSGTSSVPVPFVPSPMKRACYQQAIYVLKNASALAAANAHRARQDGSPQASGYAVDPYAGPSILSPLALHYLGAFMRSGSSRGMRSLRMSSGYVG